MSSYGVVTVSYSVRVVCMLLVTWCTDCRQTVDTAIVTVSFCCDVLSLAKCIVCSVSHLHFENTQWLLVCINTYIYVHVLVM